jgi:hypothetical protein
MRANLISSGSNRSAPMPALLRRPPLPQPPVLRVRHCLPGSPHARCRLSPPSRRWLCRVWSDLNSSEIALRPVLPWLARAWGGMRQALAGAGRRPQTA